MRNFRNMIFAAAAISFVALAATSEIFVACRECGHVQEEQLPNAHHKCEICGGKTAPINQD